MFVSYFVREKNFYSKRDNCQYFWGVNLFGEIMLFRNIDKNRQESEEGNI